jgi:hypothetical protein
MPVTVTRYSRPQAFPRRAVRRGASWTAAYHRQLTVAAVASPIRGRVGALGVLAVERSWWLLAQTASARRSVQPVSRGRASSPWSTRPAGTPRRRSPVSSRRCPPIRSRRPGSGCPAVRCPVTWGRRPAVRRSAVCCPPVRCPAVCCPPVRCPAVWCPAVWCLPRPSGRVRLLPCSSGGVGGLRSRRSGDRDHRNRWGPRWLPSRRRLDRRSQRPGRGRRCRSRVGHWQVGGGPGPPGWVRAAAAVLAHSATRQARPALGAPVAGGCAVGTGAGSARWRQPPRSGRPRAGCLTTLRGRRRA